MLVTPFVGVWIETPLETKNRLARYVTPFVGVWIETYILAPNLFICRVTPFVGVWIETGYRCAALNKAVGHTLRGCVDWNLSWIQLACSKPCHTLRGCVDWNLWHDVIKTKSLVTPFVGVWIETHENIYLYIYVKSHPSWVCGLKHLEELNSAFTYLSHPSWVCGLKQHKSA